MNTEAIVSSYRELKNGPAVGRKFGIGSTTVYRILEQAGEPRVGNPPPPSYKPPRKFSEDQERDIARRYASGELTSRLAKEFSCSKWLVRDIAVRHGSRTFGRGNRNHEFSSADTARLIALQQEGTSHHEIARHFGCSQVVISRVLNSLGVAPKRHVASGSRHGSWKGGRVRHPDGYVLVLVPTDSQFASMRNRVGYVLEHRLVMATDLGRPLTRNETVHHLNGVRNDNRRENLELWKGKHPRGIRANDKHCETCTCHVTADRPVNSKRLE